nr:putative BPI/LBP family protein At1g04970 [Tanacetum cinerariifolium]GEY69469.1 putative BPI/LBP family protein At1g04970 [Tanacetum cinerariifolium]
CSHQQGYILDSVIQSLPKQVSFGDTATLNVTVSDGPIMSTTSLLTGIDGLFTQIVNEVTYGNSLSSSISVCNNPMKTVAISVHEDVHNSASLVYFNIWVMVVVGECGEGSVVHWWRRVKKVVVEMRYGGVMVVEKIEWKMKKRLS